MKAKLGFTLLEVLASCVLLALIAGSIHAAIRFSSDLPNFGIRAAEKICFSPPGQLDSLEQQHEISTLDLVELPNFGGHPLLRVRWILVSDIQGDNTVIRLVPGITTEEELP
jgi:hypothetical protein